MTDNAMPLIAHVIHRLDVGGLENGIVNLVNRMPANHYRHAIVCLAGFNPDFRDRIERLDVEVISLDKQPGKDVGVYFRFWRLLRRLRPDIVHTRNFGTVDLQWIAAVSGVHHRIHGEHGWEASDPKGVNLRSLRIRRACRPAIHRWVPMSQDIARWLERAVGVAPSRIQQLYNGVDTEKFKQVSSTSVSGVREGLVTIGTVGRLDPVKNQEYLIRALRAIIARYPQLASHLRLNIVGDGPLRAALENTAAGLGIANHVRFTGACSDMPVVYQAMDLYVLPSLNEGISNTILEAMATGLPVVAGKIGGNPEVVIDGVTGRLFEPSDPAGLEGAILPYLTDSSLRRVHGRAGRTRVVQNFSLDSMVQSYLKFYDEITNSRSVPRPLVASTAERGSRSGEGR